MKRVLAGFILGVLLGTWNVSFAENNVIEDKKAAAVVAAHNWLVLVDEGDYDLSWEESASYFKSLVTKESWHQTIAAIRSPLGKVLARELKEVTYTTSLPGAPDGKYIVIQFSTSYAQKAEAIETITRMKDEDGYWRISGYFIR